MNQNPIICIEPEKPDVSIEIKVSNEGEPGYTPQRGIDYWTDADKREIVDDVKQEIGDLPGGGDAGNAVQWSDDLQYAGASDKATLGYAGPNNDALAYTARNGKAIILPRSIDIGDRELKPDVYGIIKMPEEYTPVAATKDHRGGVVIGDGIEVEDGGRISVPLASNGGPAGLVAPGKGLEAKSGNLKVKYDEFVATREVQSLGEEAQARARENIGAASAESVDRLSEEKVDKNGVDQVTKDNAEFVQLRPSVNLFNKETMVTLGTWYKWSGGTGAGATVELESNQWTGGYAAIEIPIYQSGNIAIQMGKGTDQEVKIYSYYFTDENNVATESYGIGVQTAITNGYVLSAPSGAKKLLIALTYYNYNLQAGKELMVNYGTDVLPWEPYAQRYALEGVGIEDERIDAAASIVGKTSNEVLLMLPEQYALVVGDTFELFYKGIINAANPDIFDIKITCNKGKAYTKRYVWTPTADDIGSHVLTAELYGINHNLLHKKSVNLVVKGKASSPATPLNILCVGDSLTEAGVWPVEFHRRLTASDGTPAGDGMTNINFIGSVESNGVKFEGHGGWSIASYITSNNGENPFWNAATGQLDFGNYLAKVGASSLDYVYLLIGWNDAARSRESYLSALDEFIRRMKNEYPNVKVVLLGLQLPARDGLGENYGANGVYADYYSLMQYVFDHEKLNAEVKYRFPQHVSTISIAGQFDTENNMPTATRTVNARSTMTETYQNNGVHPAAAGYKQIADAVYRDLTHKLQS